ncbi:MAG: hypothetical protein ACQESR_27810 [Planctomycetota bacterium]
MTCKKWQIGDVYYQASGELNGEPRDLGCYGKPCHTREEAEENARMWLSGLPCSQRRRASAWVRPYRVTEATEDEVIASTSSDGLGTHVEEE